MTSNLNHPFIFIVHALLLGAALLFVHQACVNFLLFKTTRRKTFLVYTSLALLAAINCIVTFLPILPVTKLTRVHLFHYMWFFGSLVYFTYIEALRRYLRLASGTLRRTQRLIAALAIIPLASSLWMAATGEPFLYDLAPSATPGIIFSAIGNPFSGNLFTTLYVSIQGGVALFMSVSFIVFIMRRKERDYYVLAGLIVSIVCLAAEMAMAGGAALYSMPLLVFADIIEIFRMTHVSTVEMSKQVNHLQRESTKQKQIIEEQFDELEASGKLTVLGEMTGGISHEIKGPLQTIRGYLELTEASLDQYAAIEDQDIREYIARSNMAVDHITSIISVVNAFAAKDRGQSLAMVELKDIVESALNLCSYHIKCKGVEIFRNLPDFPTYTLGQRTQLVQVLINLINNACDAIEDLPERSITISAVMVSDRFFIKVTDSGNGIAQDVRRKIGQAFFSTKAVGKGQGLGLRISSRIIQRHQGRLFIDETCPNTRFVIELPMAPDLTGVDSSPREFMKPF